MNPSRHLLAVATSLAVLASPLSAQTLKVFLLAGQSNMQGQAFTFDNSNNVPSLEFLLSGTSVANTYLTNMPFDFKNSLAAAWMDPRTDAWCVHYDSSTGATKNVVPTQNPADIFNGVGPLSPGFGVGATFSTFGAELAMGTRIADATTDPVFLFKSDQGGTTLAVDWRPPSAVAARGGVVGPNYTNTVIRFADFLDTLDADLLDDGVLNAYGNATDYEICGFFWLQGFNDGLNSGFVAEYGPNLIDLVHDIRAADARIPADLPCIVIESSDQNTDMNTGRANAVATLNAEIPGSAAFFESENMINGKPGPVFWGNNPDGVPFSTSWGFHFHSRAENFLELGWIAGGAVLDNSWLDASDFWVDRPVATSVAFNQADISTAVNEPADTVTVYWGTSDPGPTATGWDQSASLGAQAAGAIPATLTGLAEDTTYFVRVHATSTALGSDVWSAPNSLTTPLEFPAPVLGDPSITSIQVDGATVESTLLVADADVTLVWALSDEGATDVVTWTSAAGGGSFSFGSAQQGAVLSHAISGLVADTTYFVRFVGTNAIGEDWTEVATFAFPGPSPAAATLKWIAGADGAWGNAANWQTNDTVPVNRLPTVGDQVNPGGGGHVITHSPATGTTTFKGFNTSGANPVVINQSGGMVNVTDLAYLSSNASSTNQPNYTISGGSVSFARSLNMTWNNTANATSTFIQAGGSVTLSDALKMAIKSTGQSATYQLQDGTFTAKNIIMGDGGNTYTTLFDQTGGDAVVKTSITLGRTGSSGGSAIYHLGGGTLTIEDSVAPFVFSTQALVTDYFDFNGGTLNLEGTWDFTSLTAIANADFRVGGVAATSGDLDFQAIDIDGTGFTRITVASASSPFDSWATSGTVTGVTFHGDANGDGVQDGLAFLLGAATPDADANGLLPTPEEDGSGGLQMVFTMLKPANSAPAVLSLEHSADLGIGDPWASVVVPAATGPVGDISFTVTDNAGDPTQKNDVVATIPATGNALDGKLFGRLAGAE